jgi:hypothetical protein
MTPATAKSTAQESPHETRVSVGSFIPGGKGVWPS